MEQGELSPRKCCWTKGGMGAGLTNLSRPQKSKRRQDQSPVSLRLANKVVQRIPKKAGGVPVSADLRLFPIRGLLTETGCNESVTAETFMHVMLRENCSTEVLQHREAALMGQWVTADW
jgi:hypothetical protein